MLVLYVQVTDKDHSCMKSLTILSSDFDLKTRARSLSHNLELPIQSFIFHFAHKIVYIESKDLKFLPFFMKVFLIIHDLKRIC